MKMIDKEREAAQKAFNSLQEQILNELQSKANYQNTTLMQLLSADEELFNLAHSYTLVFGYLAANASMKPNAYTERISSSDLSYAALKILEIHAKQA